MANKYTIKINPGEPSAEQIGRHQDFAALLQQYQQQPEEAPASPRIMPLRSRRLVYISTAIAAAILLLLVFLPTLRSIQPADSAAYFADRPYVDPPALATVTPATQQLTVDVNQGGVFEYPTGSRLVVPVAAFANDRGELIGGEVTIHYRELHDHVDFFVGGIPMAYDSASVRYFLESGGMVEIYAEQNGERVKMAPGKTIEVDLVSDLILDNPATLDQYRLYRLDETARNWQYRQVALQKELAPTTDTDTRSLAWSEQRKELEASYRAEIAQLEAEITVPLQPVRPEKATGDRPTISLNFLEGDIQLASGSDLTPDELERLHEGAIWEISPQSPPINLKAFNVDWKQVQLRRLGGQNYQLTLINPEKSETLVIRPALTGNAYEKALDQYAVDQKAYEAALAERDAQLADRRQEMDTRYAKLRQNLEAKIADELSQLDRKEQRRLARRQVTYRFSADAFGIWQIARPLRTDLTEVKARFVDESGKEIANRTVYLADDNRNTVYRYLAATGSEVGYDPAATTLMWLVGEDGSVRVLSADSFRRISVTDDLYTFELKQPVPPVRSEAELRAALSFE